MPFLPVQIRCKELGTRHQLPRNGKARGGKRIMVGGMMMMMKTVKERRAG